MTDPRLTGVQFTNLLRGDACATSAVAHNGSGVGVVDGDGSLDLFENGIGTGTRLFLNDTECQGQYPVPEDRSTPIASLPRR